MICTDFFSPTIARWIWLYGNSGCQHSIGALKNSWSCLAKEHKIDAYSWRRQDVWANVMQKCVEGFHAIFIHFRSANISRPILDKMETNFGQDGNKFRPALGIFPITQLRNLFRHSVVSAVDNVQHTGKCISPVMDHLKLE